MRERRTSISPPYKRHQPWSPSSREELWLGAWASTSSEKHFQQPSLLSELEPKRSLAKWILTQRDEPRWTLSNFQSSSLLFLSRPFICVCASRVDVTAHWHFYLEAERPWVSMEKLCCPPQLCIFGGVAQPWKICTSAPQFTRPSSLLGPFDRHPFYLKQLFILCLLTPNTKN